MTIRLIPLSIQRATDDTAGGSGQPPTGDDMEARVAKLEAIAEHVQRDLQDLKSDVRSVRTDIVSVRTTDFRLLFGAIVFVALGLAGLMARGFHWL